MYLDSMNLPSLQKKKKKKKKVTENRGSENIWLKIRARPKLTTRIFGHLWPVTSRAVKEFRILAKTPAVAPLSRGPKACIRRLDIRLDALRPVSRHSCKTRECYY